MWARTAAAVATEELPQSIQVPSSAHPGTTYPVRAIPHSDGCPLKIDVWNFHAKLINYNSNQIIYSRQILINTLPTFPVHIPKGNVPRRNPYTFTEFV